MADRFDVIGGGARRGQAALWLVSLCILLSGCGDDSNRSGAPTPTATPIASLHERFITDAQGRALILHGINVAGSAKDDPWRLPWISRDDAERVRRDWGFNMVRLLIFWDAVEPSPGQYDDGYLERVAERIAWFAAADVYVILDMHQDVYGHFDAQGNPLGFDGAPSWAARTDGLPHHLVDPWALTYLQAGVRRAFDNFWDDTGPNQDLQEHYAAMWAHVAGRFKAQAGVLGYNVMNEPFAGSAAAGDFAGIVFGDLQRSQEFQETLFHRFNERVIAAIRQVDPDRWVFYEPLAFPANNGGPSYLGQLDDPRAGEPHLVYFPHLYAIAPEVNLHYDPANSPELDSWFVERRRELSELHVPLQIGEFGLPWDAGGDPLGYLQKILNMADELTSGWAYWSYDPGNWAPVAGDDRHETPNASVLVRAYPQRVAGRPISYRYDPESRRLDLTFVDVQGVTGATEIYVPARRFYPAGWRLQVDDVAGSWASTWDSVREVVGVTTPRTGALHHISIVPATTQQ